MKQQHFMQCPHCDSKAFQYRSGTPIALFFLVIGVLTLFAGVLFPPLWIFTISSFFIFPFMFLIPKHFLCLHCRRTFKVDKSKPKQPSV